MSMNAANVQQTVNKSNIGAELGTNIAFSGVMSGGFGSVSSIKSHGGIKRAIQATKENNKVLRQYADTLTGDKFINNLKTSYNYQEFTRLSKQGAKAAKKLAKLENATDLPWTQKLLNVFRKPENKIDLDGYKKIFRGKVDNLSKAAGELQSGKSLLQGGLKTLDGANNIRAGLKGLFKSEMKDPFGIFFAATETISRFTSEALPAFKNEGFGAGLKATGKALAAGAATLVADAGFSVAFRTIGATIGSIAGPVGTAIGSMIGNAIGALASNKLVQKLFPQKEKPEEAIAQAAEQTVEQTVEQAALTDKVEATA